MTQQTQQTSQNSLVNVVIPAAGLGTRLKPLSSNSSKVMVPVNGKPCLEYILEQVDKLPFKQKNVVIVDGALDDIRDYVESRNLTNVTCTKQESLNGPLDAIVKSLHAVKEEYPVLLWLGDAIFLDPETGNMKFDEDFLVVKEVSDQSAWCMWDLDEQFFNKPTESVSGAVALTGVYYFYDGEAFVASTLRAYDAKKDEISDMLEEYQSMGDNFLPYFAKDWYDIGDIANYHKTCAILLNRKARSFNRLEYDQELNILHKLPVLDGHRAEHALKTIKEEREWYLNLDWKQKQFVPTMIEETGALSLSYETGTLLSDLLIYENLPTSTWEYLLDKIFNIMTTHFHKPTMDLDVLESWNDGCREMWLTKTSDRLVQAHDCMPRDRLIEFAAEVYNDAQPITGMHGDLHLGNILYNPTSDKMVFLDPRGNYGVDAPGVNLGDNIYDFAKLAHDLYYGYNHHVAKIDYYRRDEIREIFVSLCKKYNVNTDIVLKGGLVLLASCTPLHDDMMALQRMHVEVVRGVKEI